MLWHKSPYLDCPALQRRIFLITHMDHTTSYSLLEKAINLDDNEAWQEIISRYRAFVCHIVRNFNVSEDDFEDIVQMCMIKLTDSIKTFDREKGKFRSWFSTLIKNQCLMYIRTRKKELKHRNAHENQAAVSIQSDNNVTEQWISSEWENYISSIAMERVRATYRGRSVEVFEMFLKGMTAEDIINQTGLTMHTVYSMKARVKKSAMTEVRAVIRDLEGTSLE